MLTLETTAKIRRDYFVHEKSIRQISRERHVSRNTVRKVIRKGSDAFVYSREIQPRPLLGDYVEHLETMLENDWQQPRKKRLTAKRLHEDLVKEGFQGGYDTVRRFVKKWRDEKGRNPGTVFVPLAFDPGSVCQFDWSHEHVVLAGEVRTIKIAHFRLAFSRMPFLMAFMRESVEMVLEAHNRAFEFYGGNPRQGVYDNLKTVVRKVLKGKERLFSKRFQKMCDHFLMEPVACSPAAGWEKGQVEKQVQDMRRWLLTPMPHFADLEELNAWLADQCWRLAAQRRHPEQKERTIAAVFQEEREYLIPFVSPFEAYQEQVYQVSSTSLVGYDRNHYSVDCRAAKKMVTLRAYADRVHIFLEDQIVADHPRCFKRGSTIYNPWHYLDVLERKPGAIRHGAPFRDWALPDALSTIRQRLEKRLGGDREFVSLLLAGREHGVSSVEQACQWALQHGVIQSNAIINRLSRTNQPSDPEPIVTSPKLILHEEPTADCARYDRLLEASHASP